MTAAESRTRRMEGPLFFKPGVEYKHRRRKAIVPAVNIDESDQEYILMLAAPGFSKEVFVLKIEKNILSVEASKKPDNLDFIHDCCEYDFNHWKREFILPDDADGLMTRAKYLNGELIISIPKGKTGDSPFTIPIYVY
ncbi:MAG: Hsp20 family protein [Sphingobacteriales bacterium]|nr:Hsp20 family protein [Sphingobacteriales bacterium]